MLRLISRRCYSSTRVPSSSTSAISFKKHILQRNFGPVPTAEDAVRKILRNTPDEDDEHENRYILSCLAQNEPGVINKVSSVLASRNFNIESLIAADTEVPDLSRMTIVLKGKDVQIEQAKHQVEDLVPVWAVLDYTNTKLIERELLLIKVSILGPDELNSKITAIHSDGKLEYEDHKADFNNTSLEESAADALRDTFDQLRAISELATLFEGRIVDVSSDSVVVELCAKSDRITSFMKLCKPFGIIEAARSGVMALPRAPLDEPTGEDTEEDDVNDVDISNLPPG